MNAATGMPVVTFELLADVNAFDTGELDGTLTVGGVGKDGNGQGR